MSVNDSLPHGGRTWCPWPHDPPEGWPYEYVARVDYDALAARLAEAEELLREALDALPTKSDYESRVQYLRELRDRIDAHLRGSHDRP